jgi:hypothetical protein
MWLQFFSQDAHFTIHLFAALVCLAVTWLYLDAWSNKRSRVGLLRWAGFGILSLSFLAQATVVEQSVLGSLTLSHQATGLVIILRIVGYLSIIAGQLLDPLQKIPEVKGLELEPQAPAPEQQPAPPPEQSAPPVPPQTPPATTAVFSGLTLASKWLVPLGGLTTAALYWRRATTGLERHLRTVAIAFLLLGFSDLVHLAALLRTTSNPILFSWIAAFGPVWWVEQLLLLAGVAVLGKWVWSYLTERFFSQLFMILVSTTVAIFLIVSVSFTALLLRNVRSDMVANLHTAAQVVGYALAAKQSETTSGAELLAGNQNIAAAITAKDHKSLIGLTSNYLAYKKQSSLMVTDPNGQVLLRGEDPAHFGDSVSSDTLIRRALLGSESASVVVSQGVGAPVVEVRSSVPVYDSQKQIIGSVTTGITLDQAFVNGLQAKTGLQSSVYGSNIVSATTILGADGTTHLTGTLLSQATVKKQVLTAGRAYSGDLVVGHRSFLGSIVPLKDADNVPVGMLMVAEPQRDILLTAGKSVELTFILTAVLLLLSVAPAYFITKSLTKQLDH